MPPRRRDAREEESEEEDEVSAAAMEKTYCIFALLQALGVACIILVFLWAAKYLGGFEWDGSGKMFNWHPVLMVIGFVYLYGNAAVMYRVLRTQTKLKAKVFHASIHTYALCVGIVGLIAVLDYHHHQKIPDFYSIHSWIGIVTFLLFGCQLVVGLCGFLYPKFNEELRAKYMKIHVYFGGIIFIFAIIACISGINQKLIMTFGETYSHFASGAVVGNALGMFILLFGMLVALLLYKELY